MSDIGFVDMFTTLVMVFAAVIAAYLAIFAAFVLVVAVVDLVRYPFTADDRRVRRLDAISYQQMRADMEKIDRTYRERATDWQSRPIGTLHGVEVIPKSREEQVAIQCMEAFVPYRMDA